MIPATVITVGLTVAVDVRLETKIRQLYEVTSIMAKDVLSNIRDVLASTASDDILSRYDKVLEKAKEIGIKKAPAIGIQHASEVFFVTCGYALSFWYGTQLYSAGGVSIGSILTYVSTLFRPLTYISV
jgi:ATP-binding cassette subfamily B (MDR/TAP) protein 1